MLSMVRRFIYSRSYILQLMSLIICLWLLHPIEADQNPRKTYIIYMGNRVKPYVPAKTMYLKMLGDVLDSIPHLDDASKYLLHTYKSFPGCVATLTEKEAKKMSGKDGVVSVFPNRKTNRETTRSWDFMGLPLNVERSKTESDVIVGVIDLGIWPESESFNDDGFGPPPPKWKGKCQTSHNFTCNNKIIGAQYFRADGEFSKKDIKSARDSDGHGTHTSSTIAGGVVSMASFLGLGLGTARGGVPSARLAVYKSCWDDGCWDADVLAAFDAAIADGVDLISVSLGGTIARPYFEDPFAIGAYHAMIKGILTSTSAGNEGPGLRTTTKSAPWLLSVAASTMDRRFVTVVKLGNGMVVEGISLNTFDLHNKTFPLIYGGDAQNASSSSLSSFCFTEESLNRTLVKGKIVLCDSLITGEEPFLAGAAGIIMQDLPSHDYANSYPLPASYLSVNDATHVLSYIRNLTSTPYGTILKSVAAKDTSAPVVASFSSRGPNSIAPGILKPDVSAPGVSIVAAWSPIANVAEVEGDKRSVAYNILSGTSMACPHATAVAAYVKSFHPTWSPASIKSALMTTAFPMSNAANEEAEFAYGSGHINPMKAIDPGLVYDTQESDYVSFLCSQGLNATTVGLITGDNTTCHDENRINGWDLNYPSITLPTTSGPFDAVFNRTVTNVGSPYSKYRATVSHPEGKPLMIKVQPPVLLFNRLGQKLSFTVRVYGTIGLRALMSASLVWDDGEHQVRSPIVVYNLS